MRLARSEIECEPFQPVAEDGEVCNVCQSSARPMRRRWDDRREL
jgi:hypothetical protein